MPGITPEQLVRLDKLAQTVVFTSQGIPFIYAGEEVMRDKKGVDNSYKSPDAVNAIDWRRKTTNEDVFTYYKRLIDLRKSHPALPYGRRGNGSETFGIPACRGEQSDCVPFEGACER